MPRTTRGRRSQQLTANSPHRSPALVQIRRRPATRRTHTARTSAWSVAAEAQQRPERSPRASWRRGQGVRRLEPTAFIYDAGNSQGTGTRWVSSRRRSRLHRASRAVSIDLPGYSSTPFTLEQATSAFETTPHGAHRRPRTSPSPSTLGDSLAYAACFSVTDIGSARTLTGADSSQAILSTSALMTNDYGALQRAGVPGSIDPRLHALHIGGGVDELLQAPDTGPGTAKTLSLSDEPELRIDPTTLVNSGTIGTVANLGLGRAGLCGRTGRARGITSMPKASTSITQSTASASRTPTGQGYAFVRRGSSPRASRLQHRRHRALIPASFRPRRSTLTNGGIRAPGILAARVSYIDSERANIISGSSACSRLPSTAVFSIAVGRQLVPEHAAPVLGQLCPHDLRQAQRQAVAARRWACRWGRRPMRSRSGRSSSTKTAASDKG